MTTGTSRTSRLQAAGSAAVLALGVTGWEQALHAARGVEPPGPWLPHLLLDSTLAFPLALLAVLVARRARNGRAVLAAGLFTLLLVPAVGLHHSVHSYLSRPAFPAPHALHAGFEHSGSLLHGARDALAALPVAFAIAMVTLGRRTIARRRRGIAALAAATAFTMLPVASHGAPVITPFNVPLPIPATLTSSDITLTAAETPVQILPGAATNMWTFNGAFPGPTIRRPSGQPTRVTVVNDLPATVGDITLHHHGNHSTSADDGQPHDLLISQGGSRTYNYDFTEGGTAERGAFQWYHDHHMDVTGRNVWMGLAGMVILDDPAEATINAALPNGERDVPLMVVDRTFDGGNQIPYTFNPEGNLGTATLVNGAPQPYFEVADVRYRFRILNASNTRSYTFALSDGRSMTQVATESGLLPNATPVGSLTLGPAERAEVIVDFSGELDQDVVLLNSGTPGANLSQVIQFRVRRDETEESTIPYALRAAPAFDDLAVTTVRPWIFGRDLLTGEWQINLKGFDPSRVDAQPKLGTTERWIFVNTTDVDHIVHIHDVDWHIVARTPGYPPQTDGLLGQPGLKESFRLRPDEVVVVESRFTDHLGRYVLHCHMLEHEDRSMMAQFEVVP